MGLTFKPSKCRSLSICSGRPKPVLFHLTDPSSGTKAELKSLETDPHKFLGCTMTFNNTPQDHLAFVKEKLSTKLVNLDKTLVRAEYKIAVYTRYALPALRYHLTVHTMHKTHLAPFFSCLALNENFGSSRSEHTTKLTNPILFT